MAAYYTPPLPPRQPLSSLGRLLLSHWLTTWRRGLQDISRESLWVVAGLVVAHVMGVSFYIILVDHMAQINGRRVASDLQSQQRHGCAIFPRRMDRDQCLASLMQVKGDTAPVLAQK